MKSTSFRCAAPLLACIGLALAAGGCASPGSADDPALTPPEGSALGAIEPGMSGADVRRQLGEPEAIREYQTWKSWSPFYFGQDTARTDWSYPGEGRVLFARNRYSGALRVFDVAYEPGAED